MVLKSILLWLWLMSQGLSTKVPAINPSGSATGCNNISIACTYTDIAVTPGPHSYFVVAENSDGFSLPSNRVDIIVPSGIHNVVLNWNPSITTTPTPTYFVYRFSAPSGVVVTNSN